MSYSGSQAQAGRGSQLSIGASPILIGEVKDVPLDRGKWAVVDTTNFESGSDSEQLVTIRKPGSCTFKFNRVSTDAGQAAVLSWKIRLTDTSGRGRRLRRGGLERGQLVGHSRASSEQQRQNQNQDFHFKGQY